MNKKNFTVSLFITFILIIISQTSVKAQENNVVNNRLGTTSINAMNTNGIAFEDGILYYSLDGEYQDLYRYFFSTGIVEKISDGRMTGINVLDKVVYGYIDNSMNDDKVSGIYKIDTKKENELTLVHEVVDAYNILVVEDYIYYLTQNEYGDTDLNKVKVDGSGYEVVLEIPITSFTFYKDKLYILSDEGLFKVQEVDNVMTFKTLSYIDEIVGTTFSIKDDYIYFIGINNDIKNMYRISINDSDDVQFYSDTGLIYDFDITDNYIVATDMLGNIIRISIDGKEIKKFDENYGSDFICFNNSVYFFVANYYNGENKEYLWKTDINLNNELVFTPFINEDYYKIKDILAKTSQSMKDVKRFDAQFEVSKKINGDIDKTNITYRIDKKNKVMNERIDINNDELNNEKDIVNQWISDNNIYYSTTNNLWRTVEYTKNKELMYYDFFDLYNFINDKDVFCSKFHLEEDDESYILQGENFVSQYNEINNNYWLNKYINSLDEMTIYINKSNYRITKIDILSKQYNVNERCEERITITGTNMYSVSSKLQVNNKIYQSLSNLADATKYINKATKANKEGNYKQAIKYCNNALDTNKMAISAYKEKALALLRQGNEEEALEQLQLFIDYNGLEDINDVYLLFVEIYNKLEDYDKAAEYAYKIRGILDKESVEEVNEYVEDLLTISTAYIMTEQYYIVSEYIDKVLELDKDNDQGKYYKMLILVSEDKEEQLLQYTNELLKNENCKDKKYIYYYNGKANLLLDNQEEALLAYEKAQECADLYVSNYDIYYDYAIYYIFSKDYEMAKVYANKLDGDYIYHKDVLNELIKVKEKPSKDKIGQLVLDNYLYLNKEIEKLTKEFIANGTDNIEDIENYINNMKLEDDKFTFFIKIDNINSDEELDEVTYSKINDNIDYVKISSFENDTSNKFINCISQIQRPYNKTLIIDLRDNMGGLTSAATDILDILLEECSPCYFVDRDGYITSVYSDNYRVPFSEIKVLVNNDSASSSELLALGLKKFANNVEILGKRTYGKGVTQDVYLDEDNRFELFLVSSYWNILEENVNGVGIQPDIIVESDNLVDYIEIIEKEHEAKNVAQ